MITKESILELLDVAHDYINRSEYNNGHSSNECQAAHLAIDALKAAVNIIIHNNF